MCQCSVYVCECMCVSPLTAPLLLLLSPAMLRCHCRLHALSLAAYFLISSPYIPDQAKKRTVWLLPKYHHSALFCPPLLQRCFSWWLDVLCLCVLACVCMCVTEEREGERGVSAKEGAVEIDGERDYVHMVHSRLGPRQAILVLSQLDRSPSLNFRNVFIICKLKKIWVFSLVSFFFFFLLCPGAGWRNNGHKQASRSETRGGGESIPNIIFNLAVSASHQTTAVDWQRRNALLDRDLQMHHCGGFYGIFITTSNGWTVCCFRT